MASSSSTTESCDTGLCPICHEKYCIPRSLSTCGHVFCEKCLFSFVLNLKENGELGSNFQCPVCQEVHPVQDSEKVTLEWIKTFPLCEKYIGGIDESLKLSSDDASPTKPCGPCEETGMTTSGEKYCKDCQAYLCGDCITSHSKFKPLKSHKILEETDTDISENILAAVNQYTKCPKHPSRDTELFCMDMEELICFKCASTSHKGCTQHVDIAERSDLSKVKVAGIRVRILKSQEHLRKLQTVSIENRKVVNDQLETLVKEVESIKRKVTKSMDDMYENVLARKKQLKIDMEDQQVATKQSCEKMFEEYEKQKIILDSTVKHGNQLEIFATADRIEKDIDKLESKVFQFDTNFTVGDVDCKVVNDLKTYTERIDPDKASSISIKLNSGSHKPRFFSHLEKPTPYQVEKHVEHRVYLADQFFVAFANLSIRHDRTMVLCETRGEKNDHLCLYNTRNEKQQIFKMNRPFCAAFINGTNIAVTQPDDKTIAIVSTDIQMSVEKSLKTVHTPKSIVSLKNGTVAISWASPPGFSISDISGATIKDRTYFIRDSDMRKFKYFDYMAVDERREHVIQPCIEDNAVYCFDFAAKPVFEYTNWILKPQGVAVDERDGSVFVCDEVGNSIHQLSSTGQPVIIIKHDLLNKIAAICYDKQLKNIWVSPCKRWINITCLIRKTH